MFKNIGNFKSGSQAKEGVATKSTSAGPKGLKLYVDDNSFQNFYKKSVTTENPVALSLEKSEYDNEAEHVQPYINQFKTVDVCFSRKVVTESLKWNPAGISFGNWKTASSVAVNDKVFLQVEERSIEMSTESSYENLWEKVLGNQLVSMIDSAASNLRQANAFLGEGSTNASKAYPKYKSVPVLKDIEPMKLPSSLTFTFNYGSAGLFSCEQEVVRPIVALMKLYAPSRDEEDDSFVLGLAPSNEYALNETIRHISDKMGSISGAMDIFSQGYGEGSDESDAAGGNFLQDALGGFAGALTNIQSELYKNLNSAAKTILNSETYKFVTYRIGRLVLPSMLVEKTSCKFDFTQVDEYGFPYKGTFTFDGLQVPSVYDGGQITPPYA